jgi:hypothetical protein
LDVEVAAAEVSTVDDLTALVTTEEGADDLVAETETLLAGTDELAAAEEVLA